MGTDLRSSVSRLARQPLLHFLLIGVAIGALHGWLGEQAADPAETTGGP